MPLLMLPALPPVRRRRQEDLARLGALRDEYCLFKKQKKAPAKKNKRARTSGAAGRPKIETARPHGVARDETRAPALQNPKTVPALQNPKNRDETCKF